MRLIIIFMQIQLSRKAKIVMNIRLFRNVDRSTIPEALIIADRGYESYNSMAHIQEKAGTS